jgi:hypothetical protein
LVNEVPANAKPVETKSGSAPTAAGPREEEIPF